MFITFDVSPGDEGPGILLGFTDARTFDPLPPPSAANERWPGFAALFGDAAMNPIDYVDHCWGAEQFAPGGPTAAVPPGSWTTYGPWLRKPVDGIHWAGTETADKWTGFLDGAVRSGQRAADEVDRELSGYELIRRFCAHRFDKPAQVLVDLVGPFQDRAVTAGQFDELREVRRFLAMRRDETIGSRRSFSLPITSVGTVRFFSPMCWCVPSESTSARAQPPRPAGGVSLNSWKMKSAIAGSASWPTAIVETNRRLGRSTARSSGAAPKVFSSVPAARTRRPPAVAAPE